MRKWKSFLALAMASVMFVPLINVPEAKGNIVLSKLGNGENRVIGAVDMKDYDVLPKVPVGYKVPLQTASGRTEAYAKEVDGNWKFGGKLLADSDALTADFKSWEDVTIPHTWNPELAEDGGGNYPRTVYWYKKDINIAGNQIGKRIYIEFTGVNQQTTLYVNGSKVGEPHKGGYTTFRYDITDFVQAGNNQLLVKVDNRHSESIAPISGDFNMFGGIYRRVFLVTVDEVHVDLEKNGSSGLFLTTGNMRSKTKPADLGQFKVEADIVNKSNASKTVTVTTSIKGNNAPADKTKTITIPAGGSVSFSEACKVDNPTLWEGISYEKGADNSNVGYMYDVTVTIKEGSKVLDVVSDKIGFRYFWIDSSDNGEAGEGFYLNGKKHALRGVNRHSYMKSIGSAMTEDMHYVDMEIMKDLGVNTVRLCHYPQTDYFYDLCDQNGIIVWTEIPVVNMIGSANDFFDVTKNQLTELISQQYNRPSVVFWGLQNEIGNGTDLFNATAHGQVKKAKKYMYEMDELAKKLDTTGRYTTQALNRDYGMDQNKPDSVNTDFDNNTGWKSDIIAWNIYPGWYPDANFYGTFEEVMKRKTALDSRAFGLSEYGWGGNPWQHVQNPVLGKDGLTSGGPSHPENYQNLMNEEALSYINKHDELWGVYYWVMFDFAVDSRNEGSQVALNDKGLVTADRKTRKDSYYLYKANWNKADSFAYITDRRWTNRESSDTYVKVYSNCDKVELFVNGKSIGMMTNKGNGVFVIDNISLPIGNTTIKAVGSYDGDTKKYEDTVTWTREMSKKAEVESEAVGITNSTKTIILYSNMTVAEFKAAVKGSNNATYKIMNGTTEVTDEKAKVLPGMTVDITAEDGTTKATYTIMSSDLCSGSKGSASSEEAGNVAANAVDGNSDTKWVAVDASYPQWYMTDLGKVYTVDELQIRFEDKKGDRYYKYIVEVSEDGKNFTKVYDGTNNTTMGTVTNDMKNARARYIRINFTGSSTGWATIYDIKANGYTLESDDYTIDHGHKLIIIDSLTQNGIADGTFLEKLKFSGNYTYKVIYSSGWIKDGNTVEIYDLEGKKVAYYTVCTEATKDQYKQEPNNITGTDANQDSTTEIIPETTTDKTAADKKSSKGKKMNPLPIIIGVAAAVVAAAAAVVLMGKKKKTGTSEKAEETKDAE